jgi:hypothetical protein
MASFRLLAIITPDDMASEKLHALLSLGADVEQVRPASIVDKKQVGTFLHVFRVSRILTKMTTAVRCKPSHVPRHD